MNEKVMQASAALAAAISVSPEFISMRLAEQSAEADADYQGLVEHYRELKGQIEDASVAEEADFDLIGRLNDEIEAVKVRINADPHAIAMRDARVRFTEMMNMVNRQLQSVLAPDGGSCANGCAACGGKCGA